MLHNLFNQKKNYTLKIHIKKMHAVSNINTKIVHSNGNKTYHYYILVKINSIV